jgi:hypothetical protein
MLKITFGIDAMKSSTPPTNLTLSPLCLQTLDELQTEHKTNNRSETVEWLILSQKYSKSEVEKMLKDRPKRGRRWPSK